jgi:hypothetical protein
MKTNTKKILTAFRIEPPILAELSRFSDATGINKTAILERALRFYFKGGMAKDMATTAKRLKSSFKFPLHRLAVAIN